MKICEVCKKTKSLKGFYKCGESYYRKQCIKCFNEARAQGKYVVKRRNKTKSLVISDCQKIMERIENI